jgi:putative DNA primase/helicase
MEQRAIAAILRDGMTSSQALAMVQEKLEAEVPKPSNGETRREVATSFQLTELGNAERLVARYGHDLMYVPELDAWHLFDGTRYRRDDTLRMLALAKKTVRSMYAEAAAIEDKVERLKFLQHLKASESARGIQAMISLARAESKIVVPQRELDSDPWLLNVANGTIDLRTGELRPARREDRITKLVPIHYDREADCPIWTAFLKKVLPDDATRAYAKRVAGYSITGLTKEDKVFFFYGPTASGKSTFSRALLTIAGEYAAVTDFDTFLKRPVTGGPRNDIARLAGARIVCSVEVEDGQQLAEGLVKQLTGGDTISARLLHKEFFEFRPTFKIFLAANHRPRARADDDAIWRRLTVIPFNTTIPENERDPSLREQFGDPDGSAPAILAWAIEGCRLWRRDGLGNPPVVKDATAAYRKDADQFVNFSDECLAFAVDSWISARDLRDAYETYCRENGERDPLPGKRVATCLKDRGCEKVRHNGVRGWRGLRLVREDGPSAPSAP